MIQVMGKNIKNGSCFQMDFRLLVLSFCVCVEKAGDLLRKFAVAVAIVYANLGVNECGPIIRSCMY